MFPLSFARAALGPERRYVERQLVTALKLGLPAVGSTPEGGSVQGPRVGWGVAVGFVRVYK